MQNTSANKAGLVSAVWNIHIANYNDDFGLVRLISFADRVINILIQRGFLEDGVKPNSVLVCFVLLAPFEKLKYRFFHYVNAFRSQGFSSYR